MGKILPTLYVNIIPRTCFRVNLRSIVCLNVKELVARSRRHVWSLSDSSGIRTHSHLVHKRTLNHLVKLAKWLAIRLRTKRLWVRIPLLSLILPTLCKLVYRYWDIFSSVPLVPRIYLSVSTTYLSFQNLHPLPAKFLNLCLIHLQRVP